MPRVVPGHTASRIGGVSLVGRSTWKPESIKALQVTKIQKSALFYIIIFPLALRPEVTLWPMHVLPQHVSGACIGHSRSSVAPRLVLQVLVFTDVFADTADLTGLNGIKPGAPAQGGRTAARAGRAGPHVER